jgi:hypothetical protein
MGHNPVNSRGNLYCLKLKSHRIKDFKKYFSSFRTKPLLKVHFSFVSTNEKKNPLKK